MPTPRFTLACGAFLAAFALLHSTSHATPSGLNNIPTADTTPQGTFVLQTYSTVFGDADADFNLGFKTGVDFKYAHVELGWDSHLTPGKGGPVTIQGKLAVPLGEHLPTLAIGEANVTFRDRDRDRAGDEFAYVVATEDLGWFRLHAGGGLQDGTVLPFAGIDKTFHYTKKVPTVGDGKTTRDPKDAKTLIQDKVIDLFTLRGDVIEQRDFSWLYSVGVLVPVCKYFVFETWANLPDNGQSASWTIKGNFVFTF
jgi:hypothetical protein